MYLCVSLCVCSLHVYHRQEKKRWCHSVAKHWTHSAQQTLALGRLHMFDGTPHTTIQQIMTAAPLSTVLTLAQITDNASATNKILLQTIEFYFSLLGCIFFSFCFIFISILDYVILLLNWYCMLFLSLKKSIHDIFSNRWRTVIFRCAK